MKHPQHHFVVIGSGFGDEGKGLMTDYFCNHLLEHDAKPMVARFNGGGQAGHTVVTPQGGRHVFHTYGAGTFSKAPTLLGKRFILNPLLAVEEKHELLPPFSLSIHPHAPVTTIYDMLLNAAVERKRDSLRHGSCGVGINETVTRHLAGDFTLTVDRLANMTLTALIDFLERVRSVWVPQRAFDLDLTEELHTPGATLHEACRVENVERFANDLRDALLELNPVICVRARPGADRSYVFEGAQGLGLDEIMGTFPNVTRSITGLPYALELAGELGLRELQPVYVTRAYATRHGAGPLVGEEAASQLPELKDATNVVNEWQGTLRYAPLDIDALAMRIDQDLSRSSLIAHLSNVRLLPPRIAVTCLDQVGENVPVFINGSLKRLSQKGLLDLINGYVYQIGWVSRGPTRENVSRY